MMRKTVMLAAALFVVVFSLASCGGEPTSLAVASETVIPVHTSTTVPTATRIATATEIPTRTPLAAPTSLPAPSPVPTLDLPPGISVAAICRQSVDAMRALTQDLGLPDQLQEENPAKTDGDFDVSTLIAALDHLTVTQGYTLDFVYFADGLGGKPLIYARPIDDAPFATYQEFLDAAGSEPSWEASYAPLQHAFEYLEYLETDDTPEGYFQFNLMAIIGDQFYLFWHALYHDEIVLCDASDVDRIVEESSMFERDAGLPQELATQARALDLEPTVHLDEDTAITRFVLFTKWGGFVEVWFAQSRATPHTLEGSGSRILIEYDCGINF